MSKNFKPKYTVDMTQTDNINLAKIVGKLNASELNEDDLTTLIVNQLMTTIEQNNALGLIIYADGTCDFVTVEDVTDTKTTTKKTPWYKRLWNKIFGHKNK